MSRTEGWLRRRAARRGTRWTTPVALVLGLALTTAACSTVATTDAPKSVDASTLNADQKAVLDAGYAGNALEEPTADGPAAVPGKKVWAISCGEAYQACAILSSSFVEAGKELSWDVNLVDGKADPSVATAAIRQAIAAKADGIAVFSFDCPGVKSGLQAAKSAGIPVVQYTSIDCDDPDFGSEEPLYTAGLNVMGSTNISDYYTKWGAARAEYLAALLGGEGKVLMVEETSQRTQQYSNEGFKAGFAKACPDCELIEVPFTFSQIPREATARWSSALLQHPDAAAVSVSIDSLMGLGLQTALKQANFHGIVAGGEGLNLGLVRDGTQTTETTIPYDLSSWGLADTLNRIFAGEDPTTLPSEGGGWQFVDAEHNLPPNGEAWDVPFDYKSLYRDMWKG